MTSSRLNLSFGLPRFFLVGIRVCCSAEHRAGAPDERPDRTDPRAEPWPQGLTLMLKGESAYFNYHWLRDNCPTSFNAKTRERSFDIFHLQTPPQAAARIEGDSLRIDWAGEDHVTLMPLAWLAPMPRASAAPIPPHRDGLVRRSLRPGLSRDPGGDPRTPRS